jgi:predicted NAD/FAD-binding protein
VERICVVGAGVSGLGAAWALGLHPDRYQVEVFEGRDQVGGNARTVDIPQASGMPVPVDISVTAFIPSMYPTIVELMRAYNIEPAPTRFSYEVHYRGDVYGHDAPSDLRKRLEPDIKKFRSLLRFLSRFNALSKRPSLLLAAANPFNYISMERMLSIWGISGEFCYQALKPMFVNFVLASNVFGLPASLFSRYMDFFDIEHATPMTTWSGGTRRLYERMMADFPGQIHLNCEVTRIDRGPAGVTVHDSNGGTHNFDRVILACTADRALSLLQTPSRTERWLLGRVRYDGSLHDNAVVHTDSTVLPAGEPTQRSNVIRQWGEAPDNYQITYVMHNQQPWARASDRPCLVTYNPDSPIDPAKIVARASFRHVVSDVWHTVILLNLFRFIQGRQSTWHCGTHTTINSQEHGLISGLTVARQLGAEFPFAHNDQVRKWFNFYGRLMHGRSFRAAKPSVPPAGQGPGNSSGDQQYAIFRS